MEYSLLKQGNSVVLHVASGVGALTLDARKLDFFIGALEQMRETMTPPPPTKVQPPKGAEMPVNLNGAFELPPMEELHGGLLFPSAADQTAYLSFLRDIQTSLEVVTAPCFKEPMKLHSILTTPWKSTANRDAP